MLVFPYTDGIEPCGDRGELDRGRHRRRNQGDTFKQQKMGILFYF
jgi:hypothetical protein